MFDLGFKRGKELVGKTFGHWLVLDEMRKAKDGRWKHKCRCGLCGVEMYVDRYTLKSGRSKSCISCSRAKTYSYRGKEYSLKALANLTGFTSHQISQRLLRGYTIEEAIETRSYKHLRHPKRNRDEKIS